MDRQTLRSSMQHLISDSLFKPVSSLRLSMNVLFMACLVILILLLVSITAVCLQVVGRLLGSDLLVSFFSFLFYGLVGKSHYTILYLADVVAN